jgi:DNA mismatch endonuclease Vsr
MDTLTKEQRSKTMRAIKARGSKIEVRLAKALWKEGFRYRKNCRHILGKPDFVLRKYNLAIFCDSEFWHGKKLQKNPDYIDSNRKYWLNKIQKNMRRDKFVNKHLKKEGWKILRFWGNDIEKHIEKCLAEIERAIKVNG